MVAYRAQRAGEPGYTEAERQRIRNYYRTNNDARERNRAAGRLRDRHKWHNDPEYRKRKNEQKQTLIANSPRWQSNRRLWAAMASQRRRLRIAATGENYTRAEWEALCAKYDHRCLCCGEQKKLTADHIVPLSRLGKNTIDNIQPLCHSCNSHKHTKIIDYRY
jgi:hypothetical protein